MRFQYIQNIHKHFERNYGFFIKNMKFENQIEYEKREEYLRKKLENRIKDMVFQKCTNTLIGSTLVKITKMKIFFKFCKLQKPF